MYRCGALASRCMQFLNICSIDATSEPDTGPVMGRLVNHGRGKLQNSKMIAFGIDDGTPVLAIHAMKDIKKNEEILYDYGVKVPWKTEVLKYLIIICYRIRFECVYMCASSA